MSIIVALVGVFIGIALTIAVGVAVYILKVNPMIVPVISRSCIFAHIIWTLLLLLTYTILGGFERYSGSITMLIWLFTVWTTGGDLVYAVYRVWGGNKKITALPAFSYILLLVINIIGVLISIIVGHLRYLRHHPEHVSFGTNAAFYAVEAMCISLIWARWCLGTDQDAKSLSTSAKPKISLALTVVATGLIYLIGRSIWLVIQLKQGMGGPHWSEQFTFVAAIIGQAMCLYQIFREGQEEGAIALPTEESQVQAHGVASTS